MAERWQQWMPFHIDRFRGSQEVQAMHPAARSGFLYLLASAWQTDDCTISSDPIDLATESGLGDELWATYGARILRKFLPVGDRFQNAVQLAEWDDARRVFEARQANAKRTHSKRSAHDEHEHSKSTAPCNTDTQTLTGTVTTTKVQKDKSITIAPLGAAKVHPDLEIYNAYPRKEGKGAAMTEINRAVARLVKGEAPHDPMAKLEAQRYLMRRVLEYARSPAGCQSDKGKIPHPSTWFHQKRYDDDQSNWHRVEAVSGNYKGKSGHSIDAAKAAIEEVENNYASGAAWDSEAGEAGQGRLPSVCE